MESPYSYSPKRDQWHAGLIFVQLLFGRNSIRTYPDLNTLLQHGAFLTRKAKNLTPQPADFPPQSWKSSRDYSTPTTRSA